MRDWDFQGNSLVRVFLEGLGGYEDETKKKASRTSGCGSID